MEFNDENIFNNLGQNALLGRSRSRNPGAMSLWLTWSKKNSGAYVLSGGPLNKRLKN